jgi:class 3 adenylate cyclase
MEQRTFGPARNVSPQSLRGLHDDGATPDVPTPKRWEFEGFTLDLAGRTLTDAFGKEVLLWRSEFALLLAFLRAPGHALTREHLLNAVSGRDAEAFDRSIDVLVGRLRRKIEPDPRAPRLIVTLPGVGYKFAVRARVAAPPAEEEPDVLPPTATPTHHRAERRQLTILRCEIVSTGALAATLDPEDWFETAAAFRNCCSQIVTRFGGSVAPAAGDDVIAWFGYPEASEFDAEYAIQAGLTLVRAVPKLRVGPKVPLRARAGIASGLAVIRIRAAATESAQTVAGEASSLAAVLLSRAPADTVLIAASTRRLVRGLFEQRAVEPVAAQGFTEPIEAWQVTDRNAPASRFLALRAPEVSPLVGRDEELDLLLRRWEHAKAGRGRLVLVSGEPGIGKSRLLHAFEQRLPPETANTLRYFCSPHRAERAFFAVIEQFERAAGFLRADSAEEKVGKLETLLAPSAVSDEQISQTGQQYHAQSSASSHSGRGHRVKEPPRLSARYR